MQKRIQTNSKGHSHTHLLHSLVGSGVLRDLENGVLLTRCHPKHVDEEQTALVLDGDRIQQLLLR